MVSRMELFCPICNSKAHYTFTSKFFDVYQCLNDICNHLFAANPPQGSGEGKFSDKLYETYLKAERDDNLVRFLHSMNFFNSYSKILDFGAGPGFLCDAIKRILKEPDITCVESSKSFVEHLISKGYQVFLDLESIPISVKYDAIIIKEVIEHLQDPVSVMRSIKEHIHENSKLLITTPAGDWATNSHPSRQNLGAYQERTHIHYFTEKSLKLCVKLVGFSRCDYCYIDSFYPANLDKKSAEQFDKRHINAYENYQKGRIAHLTYFASSQ